VSRDATAFTPPIPLPILLPLPIWMPLAIQMPPNLSRQAPLPPPVVAE
jgi:hypothetical protein